MFQNLGIALGSGVDEWHRQQEESRKQTAESRADTQFKQQQAQYERQFKQQQAMDAVNAKYAGYREALKKGDYSFADGLIGEYNSNQGAWADGLTVQGQSTPQGKVLNFVGQDGKVARSVPVNAQTLSQMLDDAHMTEMKYASPEGFQNAYYKDRTHGLDMRKVGIEEKKATDAAAYQQGILGWHNKQAERPQFMQDGTGRVLAISPDGKLLGTYGSPRPVVGHGGGSGGGMGLTDEQASLLNQAMQYEEYAKQLSKSNPAAAQQYRNASIRALDGLPAKVQLGFRGKFGNAPQDIDPWDMPVKMKKMDPKTGVEIESQVPMKVADPEGFAKYQRGLAYSNINLGGVNDPQTAPVVAAGLQPRTPWYYGTYDESVTNSEGTPNVVGRGLNTVRNFFADSARKARSE